MKPIEQKLDPTWEKVLEALSKDKILAQFYKTPRHEMLAIMRLWGRQAPKDIARLFTLTEAGDIESRNHFVRSLDDTRVCAILMILGRSMKCWVECESTVTNLRNRWKVASA